MIRRLYESPPETLSIRQLRVEVRQKGFRYRHLFVNTIPFWRMPLTTSRVFRSLLSRQSYALSCCMRALSYFSGSAIIFKYCKPRNIRYIEAESSQQTMNKQFVWNVLGGPKPLNWYLELRMIPRSNFCNRNLLCHSIRERTSGFRLSSRRLGLAVVIQVIWPETFGVLGDRQALYQLSNSVHRSIR